MFPFAGSGSEVIGGIKAGFTDWIACESSEEYIQIAEARIKYWNEKFGNEENKVSEEGKIIKVPKDDSDIQQTFDF